MSTKINSRLLQIAEYAHSYLNESYDRRTKKDKENLARYLAGVDYRWQHTLRVAQYGKVIAENESVNIELVLAACYLHDIAWFDTDAKNSREHGRLGAEKAQPFLESLGYSSDQVKSICYSIAVHVDENNLETPESRILSDADNVDRYGPYRILQWCFSDIQDYDALADKLNERIARLEHYRDTNPLYTSTGRQLFAEQINLQLRFFHEFVGEQKLSVMPQI